MGFRRKAVEREKKVQTITASLSLAWGGVLKVVGIFFYPPLSSFISFILSFCDIVVGLTSVVWASLLCAVVCPNFRPLSLSLSAFLSLFSHTRSPPPLQAHITFLFIAIFPPSPLSTQLYIAGPLYYSIRRSLKLGLRCTSCFLGFFLISFFLLLFRGTVQVSFFFSKRREAPPPPPYHHHPPNYAPSYHLSTSTYTHVSLFGAQSEIVSPSFSSFTPTLSSLSPQPNGWA